MATASWGRSLADVEAPQLRRPGDDASSDISNRRPPGRRLARDKTDGRIGEVMPNIVPDRLCDPDRPRIVRLRPRGGGCEWDVLPGNLEYLDPGVAA